MFVYPTAAAIMQVNHESAFRLLDDVKESQHRLLVVAAQKSPDRTPSGVSDLFRVGTIARLVQMRDSLSYYRCIETVSHLRYG